MLHRPSEQALAQINEDNRVHWLFDSVPDIAGFIDEHDRYRAMLEGLGVQVIELGQHVRRGAEMLGRLPNLTYLHDTAVVSRRGAIVSSMVNSRRGEQHVVREALETLGVPILSAFDGDHHAFEGCLLLGPQMLFVAETERHSRLSVQHFVSRALAEFDEVIVVDVPKARRFMHPDTIYNRLADDLAVAFLPAFLRTWLHDSDGVREVDFASLMRRRGVEIVPVSDDEQRRLACSFVPLAPRVMVHYDIALDRSTRRQLERRGVEILPFHPRAMLAGGGSLRCLTLRMRRLCGQAESADVCQEGRDVA